MSKLIIEVVKSGVSTGSLVRFHNFFFLPFFSLFPPSVVELLQRFFLRIVR